MRRIAHLLWMESETRRIEASLRANNSSPLVAPRYFHIGSKLPILANFGAEKRVIYQLARAPVPSATTHSEGSCIPFQLPSLTEFISDALDSSYYDLRRTSGKCTFSASQSPHFEGHFQWVGSNQMLGYFGF